MARSIETIQNEIIASKEAEPELAEASSTSRRAKWLLLTYVVAQALNLFEQIVDALKAAIETQVLQSPAGTSSWLQAKMFDFQYDSTTAQYIQLNTTTLAYEYTTVNEDFQIITRCSVVDNFDNTVFIRVAKGTTPAALSTAEKNAAQSYIDTLGFAPITYIVQSTAADKLYLEGTIYYKGQYSADIESRVETAINTYMASSASDNASLDGVIRVTGLTAAIRGVVGVNDVVLTNIAARADATAFASKTFLVNSGTQLLSEWQTRAGYIVEEDTGGETFGDKLTYTAQ